MTISKPTPFRVASFFALLLSAGALLDGGATPTVLYAVCAVALWRHKVWGLWATIPVCLFIALVWFARLLATDAELEHVQLSRPGLLTSLQQIALPLAIALIFANLLWVRRREGHASQ